MILDISLPATWTQLSQEQLRYAYFLLSSEQYEPDQIKSLCILRWGRLEPVGQFGRGYEVKHNGKSYNITPENLAGLLPKMDWLLTVPDVPVRLDEIQGREAKYRADLQGLPFEEYLVLENNYQGFIHTKREDLLGQMCIILYGELLRMSPAEAYSVFMWFAAVKRLFADRFTHFFVPAPVDGSQSERDTFTALRKSMNTQIRALTKGDITKEKEILAMDVWRALTELDAQAEEYEELKKMNHGK